jgi:hypothetical protein
LSWVPHRDRRIPRQRKGNGARASTHTGYPRTAWVTVAGAGNGPPSITEPYFRQRKAMGRRGLPRAVYSFFCLSRGGERPQRWKPHGRGCYWPLFVLAGKRKVNGGLFARPAHFSGLLWLLRRGGAGNQEVIDLPSRFQNGHPTRPQSSARPRFGRIVRISVLGRDRASWATTSGPSSL